MTENESMTKVEKRERVGMIGHVGTGRASLIAALAAVQNGTPLTGLFDRPQKRNEVVLTNEDVDWLLSELDATPIRKQLKADAVAAVLRHEERLQGAEQRIAKAQAKRERKRQKRTALKSGHPHR